MFTVKIERLSIKRFGKSINELTETLKEKTNDELQDLLDELYVAKDYEDFIAKL